MILRSSKLPYETSQCPIMATHAAYTVSGLGRKGGAVKKQQALH